MAEILIGVLLVGGALALPYATVRALEAVWFDRLDRQFFCRRGIHQWRGLPTNTGGPADMVRCQRCSTVRNLDTELDRNFGKKRTTGA